MVKAVSRGTVLAGVLVCGAISDAGAQTYSGPHSATVRTLLQRAGGWQCPSSPQASDATPPRPSGGSCMRDSHVDSAVQLAWAAECSARQERPEQAAKMAAEMRKALDSADGFCSNAPVFAGADSCVTEHIYSCRDTANPGIAGAGYTGSDGGGVTVPPRVGNPAVPTTTAGIIADAAVEMMRIFGERSASARATTVAADPWDAPLDAGNAAFNAGRYTDAELAYRRAVAAGGGARSKTFLADTLVELGKRDEAWELYSAAINDHGEDDYEARALAYGGLADLLVHEGRLEDAEKVLRDGAESATGEIESHYNLASFLRGQGRYREAFDGFRSAVNSKLDGNQRIEVQHIRLSGELASELKLPGAEKTLKEALDESKKDTIARANSQIALARHLASNSKDLKRAEEMARGAAAFRPNVPRYLGVLGFVLTRAGKLDEAKTLLSKVTASGATFENLQYAGELWTKIGDCVAATSAWQRAYAAAPDALRSQFEGFLKPVQDRCGAIELPRGMLTVVADADIQLSLDGQSLGYLKRGESKRIDVALGKHTLVATSGAHEWKQTELVARKPIEITTALSTMLANDERAKQVARFLAGDTAGFPPPDSFDASGSWTTEPEIHSDLYGVFATMEMTVTLAGRSGTWTGTFANRSTFRDGHGRTEVSEPTLFAVIVGPEKGTTIGRIEPAAGSPLEIKTERFVIRSVDSNQMVWWHASGHERIWRRR